MTSRPARPITRIEVDVRDGSDRVTAITAGPRRRRRRRHRDDPDDGRWRRRQRRDRHRRSATTRSTAAPETTTSTRPGNDVLRGGEGNDALEPDTGTDGISGGEGIDTVVYGTRVAPSSRSTGWPTTARRRERPDRRRRRERRGRRPRTGVVTIDRRRSRRTISTVIGGPGVITGGEGADVLEGGPSNDTINARDSSPDTVICGGGVDTVLADTLDSDLTLVRERHGRGRARRALRRSCAHRRLDRARRRRVAERERRNDAARGRDRRPRARQGAVPRRRPACVCEDLAAPYECAYTPRGGDVGRNTLVAIAVDTAGQTSSVVRAVTVRRFTSPGFVAVAAARAAIAPRPTPSARPGRCGGPRPCRRRRAARAAS